LLQVFTSLLFLQLLEKKQLSSLRNNFNLLNYERAPLSAGLFF
jgi:hypothetical protein